MNIRQAEKEGLKFTGIMQIDGDTEAIKIKAKEIRKELKDVRIVVVDKLKLFANERFFKIKELHEMESQLKNRKAEIDRLAAELEKAKEEYEEALRKHEELSNEVGEI